jgi:hypothetical protein
VSDVESTKPAAEKKPEREGLPAGYRMRADAHYVEQLTSRRTDRVYTDQPRAVSTAAVKDSEAPEPELRERREPRDRRGDRVLAQIGEEVATIESALAMLGGQSSAMAQRVTLDLVKSHAHRAGWLLRAQALLDGTHRGQTRTRQLGALLGQVRDGLAAECRLAGISLHVLANDWNAPVTMDEHDFVAGLTGAVIATMGLVGQMEAPVIRLVADASSEGLEAIEVSQEQVQVPAAAAGRFFDLSWIDRPGGWPACLGAATARAVVQREGGTASFSTGDRRGSTVRLSFSQVS